MLTICVQPCQAEQNKPPTGSKTRPNIIFLLADDLRADSLGVNGHPLVQTPNIDKLAKDGVNFSNAFIATPVCPPSRISIFLGLPERVHGVGFSSSYKVTEDQWKKSYPALLKENNYHTGFIGKFGVEYYSLGRRIGQKFDYWWGHNGWTRFLPKTTRHPSARLYHRAKKDIITPIMGEAIEEFLAQTPDNKPFCLSVSFNVPHGSQTTSMHGENNTNKAIPFKKPAKMIPALKGHPIYHDLYRNKDIKIPDETGTDPYQYIPKNVMSQGGRKSVYRYDYEKDSTREHHIRYYQQITGLDKVIGELVTALKKKGIADNTVIIFTSDHGLMMGEYGMGGKGLLYDLCSKIPLFIFDPRLDQSLRDRTIDKLVSSTDLTTTILDYAGVSAPKEMAGESLRPLLKKENIKWRDELFLESLFTLRDNPFCEGIRTHKWKYIRMYDGVGGFKEKHVNFSGRTPLFEQLFDFDNDPEEKVNLIGKYADTKLLKELRQKCQNDSNALNQDRESYLKTTKCEVGR